MTREREVSDLGEIGCIVDPSVAPRANHAAEEALLDQDGRHVRVVRFSESALSLGVSTPGRAQLEAFGRANRIPLVQRKSGGSAVLLQPGDIGWAVVLPRTDPLVGSDFVQAYGRLGGPVARYLGRVDPTPAWGCPPNLSETFCPLSSRGSVLEANGKVLGGAAQHLRAGHLLHHGFLFSHVDRELIHRGFGVPVRDLERHLTALDELGVVPGSRTWLDGLAAALRGGLVRLA